MLTQQRLKEVLNYNQDTGIFTWIKQTSNRNYVGKIAGSISSQGYLEVGIDKKVYRLHRLAWLYVHGYLPEQIDHINRAKTDNRLINLRSCTNTQNQHNKSIGKNNKTGVPGVSWSVSTNKWQCVVIRNKKTHYLGVHSTLEEAARARENFLQNFGEAGNFSHQ